MKIKSFFYFGATLSFILFISCSKDDAKKPNDALSFELIASKDVLGVDELAEITVKVNKPFSSIRLELWYGQRS
ncbi:MAG: hypothetical protein WBM83_10730 [Flavobacteriaceae bacterium]